MAIHTLVADGSYLSITPHDWTTAAYTICGWIEIDDYLGNWAYAPVVRLWATSTGDADGFAIQRSNNDTDWKGEAQVRRSYSAYYSGGSFQSLSLEAGPRFWVMSRNGDVLTVRIYANRSSSYYSWSYELAGSGSSLATADELHIGRSITSASRTSADWGAIKVFERVLSDAEILAEKARVMPVSYDSLHTCLPMVAGIDRTADWSGQGNGITEVASPTAGTMGVPAAWGGLNEVAILDVSAGPVTLTATKVDFAPTFGSHEFIHILTGAKATFDPVFGSHSFAHALVATEAVFSTTFGAHEFSHALVGTKTTFDATFGSHSFAHELIATKADFATVFGSHTISELYILTASKATFDAVFGSHSFAHELVATKVDFPPTFGSHIISTAIILVATKAEFAAIFGSHALVESVLLTAAKVTFDTVFHGGLIIGLDPVVSCGLWSTQQVFNPCDQWRITLTGPSANNVSVTAVVRFE